MIRIDAVWLATAPLDMRAGTDTALARVVAVFGAVHPHTAYLFANKRANRMKVLVHDGIGIWLAARRLHHGRFIWPLADSANCSLARAQLDALGWACLGSVSVRRASSRSLRSGSAIGASANGRASSKFGKLLPMLNSQQLDSLGRRAAAHARQRTAGPDGTA